MKTQRLRILIVLNLEWNPRLGAVRVYMELAEQWRAAGHLVEHFSLSEAFRGARGSRPKFAIRQLLFAYKAAAFVKKNAARFDVVDAVIGSLPMPKEQLGFVGLIVARSVGLYRLYDRFEKSAGQRWPRRQRGRIFGRIFYTFTKCWLTAASNAAVRYADLVNVPNKEEADCLRREIAATKPIIVRPYGLTAERRRDLLQAAVPATIRLARKKISFIGMWAPRKGSHDWARIIARVRRKIPDAEFCFLGTMVDASSILADLGVKSSSGVEFISEYAPADLPGLLSDCTAGAFPSYVEGFGLAVLEQLAAGIPTVAFDTPGPRDILMDRLPELLVPPGDIDALADALCQILTLEPVAYEKLSERCAETTTKFNWAKIADATLGTYRDRLHHLAQPPILFVQPFALGGTGGGSRILRALLQDSPASWFLACTSPERPPIIDPAREVHLPIRPYFGKIERTRWAYLPGYVTPLFERQFVRHLEQLCRKHAVGAIHVIPHSRLDFHHARLVAQKLGLPFYLQVHDDFAFSSRGHVAPQRAHAAMQSAWCSAYARFVVCNRLGAEYCRRYGARDYLTVTDGLESVAPVPAMPAAGKIRIYFMGLFHLEYEANLRTLCAAIERVRSQRPAAHVSITLRCGRLRAEVARAVGGMVRVLPFGTEPDVRQDLAQADLLYLPLPFGTEFEALVRFSLSTKLVTYLGSGIPILYHGPPASAAYQLLAEHAAALCHLSLDAGPLAELMCRICDEPSSTAQISVNALNLARSCFMLRDQRAKFWNAIMQTQLGESIGTTRLQPLTSAG